MVEYGTAVNMLPLLLLHGSGTGFGLEDALVALAGQLGEKVVEVLVCLHLLWRGWKGRRGEGRGGEGRDKEVVYMFRLITTCVVASLHTHTHTHTHTQAHTQAHNTHTTDRQTDTHACTQAHTHTHAQAHNTHTQTDRHTCKHTHTRTHTHARKHTHTDLQGHNVCHGVVDLFEQLVLAVLPAEGPRGTVPVNLSSGILVTEHIVAHDREPHCGGGGEGGGEGRRE